MNPQTLADLVRQRACDRGTATAYGMLDESGAIRDAVSFGDLYVRAQRVAAALRERAAERSRVVIALPSGLEFMSAFLGCMLAHMIAVPVAPPKRNRRNERFGAILRDSDPAVVLTVGDWLELLRSRAHAAGSAAHVLGVDAPDIATVVPCDPLVTIDPAEVAYLQYTSGSITTPKGVAITHANVLANSRIIREVEQNDDETVSLTWLPNFHDMGLVEGLLQPLYSAVVGLIMTPAAFLQRPRLWLEAISRHRVTNSGAPNFAYQLCVDREPATDAVPLDLSCWSVAYNGAEPVRDETLRRFLDVFGRYGFTERAFYPVYGLAEATLVVTSGRRNDLPVRLTVDRRALEPSRAASAAAPIQSPVTIVASGALLDGDHRTEVVIVDPASGEALPDEIVGEIYISGPSVAAGYWNRPRETRDTFGLAIPRRPGQLFARTGDLGFIREGALFLIGRAKELIIAQGRNLYPHDIEWLAATAHEDVQPWSCAAFADGDDGRVVLVCEGKRNASADEHATVATAVRARVRAELEVELYDVVFIRKGSLPRTSSGKVQRLACRDLWSRGALDEEYSARRDGADARRATHLEPLALVDDLNRLLAGGRADAYIEPEALVCDYVTDSLRAVRLCHEAERLYGVPVPVSWFLGSLTLAELAEQISARLSSTTNALRPFEASTSTGPVRLSYGQEALWSLAAVSPGNLAYHLCRVLQIDGPLDSTSLRRALDLLAVRHDVLRTRFAVDDGVPHQTFDSSRAYSWNEESVDGLADAAIVPRIEAHAWRPFYLEHDSLFRFRLFRCNEHRHLLLVSVHHLVADLWSLAELFDELFTQYDALTSGRWGEWVPPAASYREYVVWQRQWPTHAEGRRMAAFWSERLAGLPFETALPFDRARPPVQTFAGATLEHDLDIDLASRVDRYAQETGVTPFCVLLATFLGLVHRLTGQQAVTVGVPAAGRAQARFASTLGLLANVNVVSSEIAPATTWEQIVARTQQQLLGALDAQDYPFALMVKHADIPRDPRVPPLVQLLFSVESSDRLEGLAPFVVGRNGGLVERAGLKLGSLALPQRGSQVDLQVRFVRCDGRLLGNWTFNTDLLDDASVRQWAHAYAVLLTAALDAPQGSVLALPMVDDRSSSPMRCLLGERLAFDDSRSLDELVAAQARLTPDRVAVSFGDSCLTYRQLERGARGVASALKQRGIGHEDRVAVTLDRSLALPVVLLGILKAGACYVPIPMDAPPRRVEQLLEEADPATVIRDVDVRTWGDPSAAPRTTARGDAATYVIFTSGSTGRPKGAVNTHRAIVNRLLWMQSAYGLTAVDRVLQKTPYTFDVSVWEFFWPLLAGAHLVVAPPGLHKDPLALAQLIAERQVTTVHFVPSMLASFCESVTREAVAPVRLLFCSGEALPKPVERAALGLFRAAVHNLYGPTEAAIDVTAWRCRADDRGQTVPIGLPIGNVDIRILDGALRPVVPGSTGELCIAGAALARGYLGAPDLTATSFVPDPYGDGARLYRTGDKARQRADGAIEFLGRGDLQIKIRGFRVELSEIEGHLLAHSNLSAVGVVARQDEGVGTRLVAFYVARSGVNVTGEELRRWLGERLPDYMVPAFFIALPAMPVLESGKVDRQALLKAPAPRRLSSTLVLPRTAEEAMLTEIWRQVLDMPSVGVTDGFFELGGDSLLVVRVAALARQRGLAVTAESIFRHQTIERVCAHALPALPPDADRVAPFRLVESADVMRLPAGVVDAIPLARLQQAMVYHIENSENYIAYVASVHLRAAYREELWEQALDMAMARHPYLRISFALGEFQEPLQLVHEHVDRPLDVVDIRPLSATEQDEYLTAWLSREKKRRFAWASPPLFRVTLHRRTDDTVQLTLTEVTLDGWSIAVLLSELCRTYRALLRGEATADTTPDPSYAQFVALERRAASGQEEAAFWQQRLERRNLSALPRWPREWRSTDASLHARHTVVVPKALVAALTDRAREAGVQFKSVCLAAHLAVLRTATGRDDVLTEFITHGRLDEVGGDVAVGLYTNTVPLVTSLAGMRWGDLVHVARDLEVDVYPFRRYPFAEIYRGCRTPLLDEAAFNFTHFHAYADLLRDHRDLEILGVQAFDQTYFVLTAYFNVSPVDGTLSIDLDYAPTELAAQQVEQFGEYYQRALRAIVTAAEQPVGGTSLLSSAEFERELTEWSGVLAPARTAPDVVEAFKARCRAYPDRVAVVHDGAAMTYGALRRKAGARARRLCALGVGPETGIVLTAKRELDFIVSVLAILECGGFFVPIDPGDPGARREGIARDGGLLMMPGDPPEPPFDAARTLVSRAMLAEALAYCIYTSGSTGAPKGVEVSRGALASFVDAATHAYALSDGDRVLQFASLAFDAAIEEIFCSLCVGATLVLRHDAALDSFDAFIESCSREAITVLDLPTAFWHQLTCHLRERRRAISSSVRTVILGGEKASARRLAEFREVVGPTVAVHNTYGPTEATVVALRHLVESDALGDVDVPIGRPLAGVTAYVVGASARIGPVGVVGELCLGGRSLARGYRARGDLTADRFRPNPFGPEPGARLYLTGDIVKRRPDGVVEFVGRLDAQVKIRGFRVEPAEVESVLAFHPRVEQAVVVARAPEPEAGAVLVAHIVPREASTGVDVDLIDELSDALRRALPDYMVPAQIELVSALPLTSTGKVDRDRLAATTSHTGNPAEARPRAADGPIEDTVCAIYRGCLARQNVSLSARFAELGGDSLAAMQIVGRVEDRLGVRLTVRDVFDARSVGALARQVATARRQHAGVSLDEGPPLQREAGLPLEMSFAQERLWFIHQFDRADASYNVPVAFRVHGPLSVPAFHQAMREIRRRHEVLRTRFVAGDSSPRAVLSTRELQVRHVDLRSLNPEARERAAITVARREAGRPFDLEHDELLRLAIVDIADGDALVILVMHHIVTDEGSAEIFVEEFRGFYEAAVAGVPPHLPDLPVQYADFARWQKAVASGARLDTLQAFWRRELAGAPPLLRLPLDAPREHVGASPGDRCYFELEPPVVAALRALAARHDASLFMVLLSIYCMLLRSESGMQDIVVGSPVTGRTALDTEGLVGFFANLLPLRVQMHDDLPFSSHLLRVRETFFDCHDHQALSFSQLVGTLNPERNMLYAPLVQVIFGVWPQHAHQLSCAGLQLDRTAIHSGQTKYDLEMQIADEGDGALHGFLEYNASLFLGATIARLVLRYQRLCAAVSRDSTATLVELIELARDARAFQLAKTP